MFVYFFLHLLVYDFINLLAHEELRRKSEEAFTELTFM